MAECYLCGTWIPKGEGYRRRVQTGTSQRIYVGRWSGGSSSVSQGTRTVCHTCARILDEQASGGALRGFFFLGLCGLLAVIAVRAILADYLFLGLGLLAAGPIAWAIAESMRRKAIADRVMEEDSAPALIHPSSNVAPLHQHAQDAPFEALRECFQSGDFQSIASWGNHRKRNKSYARPMSSTLFVLSTLYQA